jgi:hypothetical protein
VARTVLPSIAVYFVPFLLLPFYVLASPIMGHYYRYLYPVHCVVRALAGLAIVWGAERWLLARATPRGRAWLTVAASAAFLAAPALTALEQFRVPQAWPSLQVERRYGEALATVPGIQATRIAFADAGAVPYYSGALSLDLVGLNENQIAREGRRRGAAWVIDHVLAQDPDVVGLYAQPDGKVFNYGHGVIGTAYSRLFSDARFQRAYAYAGGSSLGWVDLHWFVRTDAHQAAGLVEALRSASDFTDRTLRP